MKIYILRDPKSVQPQTARFVETADSQTEALVEGIGAAAAPGVGEGLSRLQLTDAAGRDAATPAVQATVSRGRWKLALSPRRPSHRGK
jgi:hypothetical protein